MFLLVEHGNQLLIHTDGGKGFINKIAAELYSKLDIKGLTFHQLIHNVSEVEVFNKTFAKYTKNIADKILLNWEWILAPLILCYNTYYHRTIKLHHAS
jgi:hypothetical protein